MSTTPRFASDLVVEPLSLETFPAFSALFAEASAPCACRYWHFEGNKNAWLERCAMRPEDNLAEQRDAVARGHASARGLLARERGAPSTAAALGWMKLDSRARVPKLRQLPVYRALDLGPEDSTFVVGCFLVHPRTRRGGVARALLAAAEPFARAWGARAIEGYPRRSLEPLYDEEVWQGPESVFRDAGYEAVHDVGPYPVYRKVL